MGIGQGGGVSSDGSAARPWISATVLLLFLEQVPGIHSIRLNDQEIPDVSPETSSYQIPLDGLPARNVLVLEVESPLAQAEPDADPETSDWGCIALVIQTRGMARLRPSQFSRESKAVVQSELLGLLNSFVWSLGVHPRSA